MGLIFQIYNMVRQLLTDLVEIFATTNSEPRNRQRIGKRNLPLP